MNNPSKNVTIQAVTERQTSEVAEAQWELLSSRWASGYVEPATYDLIFAQTEGISIL